jgi:hypothetical protein
MSLPTNRGDREYNKFVEDSSGNTAIRTVLVDSTGSDIAVGEDVAHVSGDSGIQLLAVRNDSLASLAGTDGDYAPLQVDADGAAYVKVGTGATNIGKAIDSVVGSTDTGVALLAKHTEDQVHLTSSDGDYDLLSMDSLGSLHVNIEAHHNFDSFNATAGWTVLGNDTINLATTKKHVTGTDALTFDKTDGAADTIFAGIQKTLTSVDLGEVSQHDLLQGTFYIPSLSLVTYVFLRLGTSSSHYNEWQLPVAALTGGIFEVGALSIGDADYTGITGNGWDSSAITYIAVGVAFSDAGDALAGIVFDQISYHTNAHSAASINAEVTSSVNSSNVNLQKVGGSATDKNSGNKSNGSQRVVLATDDINTAAMVVDLAAIEVTQDALVVDAAAMEVLLTNIDSDTNTIQSDTTAILADTANMDTNLTAILADTAAIQTAVEILDNAISGTEMQVDVVAALPAGTNDIGVVGHNITGMGHGVKTVTTAGTDVALAGSTACKKVTIQSQTDNTGLIAVGATGVDATESTGTGIILYAGDTYEFEIDNLADIYIDSTVNGEGVRYTYFT